MRSTQKLAIALAVGCVVCAAHAAEKRYGTDDAINHVGEYATVCGFVVTAEFANFLENQPTFLNLAKRYPNEVFTAVIWGADRGRFDYVPESLRGSSICVTGEITLKGGIAQMIVSAPDQIERK
jgi:hypothetical protein